MLTCACSGRFIATEFLELPDQDELPEYYDFIKLPVALDTIEKKIKDNEYASISAIESDFKRMVQNAKEFNDNDSVIFEDAERIRKLVFNYMKQNNPAYKDDPKYMAVPTPLPQATTLKALTNGTRKTESKVESEAEEAESRQPSEKPKPKRAATEQSERKSSQAPSATTGNDDEDGDEEEEKVEDDLDFTGMSFQAAQQAIIAYLLRYTDEE